MRATYDLDGNAVEMGKLPLAAGADPKVVNGEGNPALHVALSRGHAALIPDLLKAGADADLLGGDGESPLFIVVDEAQLEVANALLAGGVNADAGDDDGKTPLMQAATREKMPMIELLLANCARTDLRDGFCEKTAAELASSETVKAAPAREIPASCTKK